MLRNASKILLIIGACYVSLILFSVFLGIAWVPVIAVADELSSDLHGELEWVDASDGEDSLLSYHGNTYYYADSWLESGLKSSDVEIGWQYGIIFPNTSYYTDGSEQPLYILAKGSPSSCGVFLRSGYDFKKQIYTVKGTDIEFVLEEALTKVEDPDSLILGDVCGTMEFSLKDAPRLRLVLFYKRDSHDGWYLSTPDGLYRISDEVILAMREAGVISK